MRRSKTYPHVLSRFRIAVCAAFLACVAAQSCFAGDALHILREAVKNNSALGSHHIEGIQSVTLIPECTLHIPFTAVYSNAPVAIRFGEGPKLTPPCIEFLEKSNGIDTSGVWADFLFDLAGIETARIAGENTIQLNGERVDCQVIEVTYSKFQRRLLSLAGPMRFWIQPDTKLIRRVEFSETKGDAVYSWTVDLEKYEPTSEPDPNEVTRVGAEKLSGKSAPDLSFQMADGATKHLADYRGKKIFLEFWGTYCIACLPEMPLLVKMQGEHPDVIFLAISSEKREVVAKWLKDFEVSLPSAVEAQSAFTEFGVDAIPVQIVINEKGIVSSVSMGFHDEEAVEQKLKSF